MEPEIELDFWLSTMFFGFLGLSAKIAFKFSEAFSISYAHCLLQLNNVLTGIFHRVHAF